MTVNDFFKMPQAMQFQVLLDKAVEVAERQDYTGRYFLFQLDSFYVELKADLHIDRVRKIVCFTDTSGLNEYLSLIDISSLFSSYWN